MTTFEIVRDLILLALGGLGAGLSLFNYFDARSRERRSIGVTIDSAIPVDMIGNLGATYLKVSGTNLGTRDVTITSIGIEVPGGGTLASFAPDPLPGVTDSALPIRLTDGDSAFRHYAYADIGRALFDRFKGESVTVTPYSDDSSGQRHRGKSFDINPLEFSRM